MRQTIVLAVLLSFATPFAGCLTGDGDAEPEPPEDHSGHGDHADGAMDDMDPGPDDTADSPPPNTPPSAGLAASIQSGNAPLNVTFTIEGDDEDGDNLTWSLDADGDGTADAEGDTLPATASFLYDTAGNYTALATVSDGTATTDANVTIAVAEVAEATLPDQLVFTGTVLGAWTGAGDAGGPEYVGTGPSHSFNFTAAIGVVQNFTVTVLGTNDNAIDLDFEIYAPDGTQVVRQANFNDPIDDPLGLSNPTDEDAVIIDDPTFLNMPGEWKVTIRPGIAVNGTYELTITFA